MTDTVLIGAHVLLLEDDAFINMSTADLLEEMGCRVSAFLHLADAFAFLEHEVPQVAVLDVNIRGTMSYELADRLEQKRVPVVFVSGYASPSLSGRWSSAPHCYKPCNPLNLKTHLIAALTAGRETTE
jgi:CheY-like chemotaxis protein